MYHLHACTAHSGQKGALDPLELELQPHVNCDVGTKFGSPTRAADALNLRVFSPAPKPGFLEANVLESMGGR